MNGNLDRRHFLRAALASAAASALALRGNAAETLAALPMRTLGKTGVQVPVIGFGTAPVGTQRSIPDGVQLFQQALEMGITYFDTAPEFAGYGKAQVQLGEAFKGRRKEVFIATKCAKAKADDALKLLQQNLKELQTDHADLVYVHSLGADEMDMNVVMGPGGVMEFLQKAKQDGFARFVGVTGHNRPDRFLPILENFDIDVIMNAVNFADRHTYNFEEKIWPVAAKKNVALLAMKVFGGSGDKQANSLMPMEHHELAFRYALSLPNVSAAILGMRTIDELKRNLDWARSFKPLSSEESAALLQKGKVLAGQWKEHLGTVV